MTKLIISDLPKNKELDRAAIAAIFGGRRYSSGFGFITPYVKASPLGVNPAAPVNIFNTSVFNTNLYSVSNTYNAYHYTVNQQNPTIYNVINSGSINGSLNSVSVNAAAPLVNS